MYLIFVLHRHVINAGTYGTQVIDGDFASAFANTLLQFPHPLPFVVVEIDIEHACFRYYNICYYVICKRILNIVYFK